MKYELGDIVSLKSGGPAMTIYEIESEEYVRCKFFNQYGMCFVFEIFHLETIQEIEPKVFCHIENTK